MALLGYNRRLGLLIAAATCWAFLGIAVSVGLVWGDPMPPPVSVSLGVPPGGVLLHGELLAIEQADGVLELTIGRPPDTPASEPSVDELPADISVTFETIEPRPPGQPRRQPPRIGAGLLPQQPRRLPGGGHLVVSDRYAVKFGRNEVRVFPRPAGQEGEWLRRMFGRGREPGQGPPEGRPGEGPPGGRPGAGPPEDRQGGRLPGGGMQRGPRGEGNPPHGEGPVPPGDGNPPPGAGPGPRGGS